MQFTVTFSHSLLKRKAVIQVTIHRGLNIARAGPSTLGVSTHLTLTKTLGGRYFHCFHFMNREMEAQRR